MSNTNPQTPPFYLTAFYTGKNGKPLNKKFSLINGEILKESNAVFSRGKAMTRVSKNGLKDLDSYLKKLKYNFAISTGVYSLETEKLENILSENAYSKLSDSDKDNYRKRSKEHMSQPDNGLVLFDYDHHEQCPYKPLSGAAALLESLEAIDPAFADASHLIRASSSNGVRIEGQDKGVTSSSLHCFMQLEGNDLAELKEQIDVRSWLAGQGWYMISKAGVLLERCLVDLSVFSQERLIFEAPATIGEGLTKDESPSTIKNNGHMLKLPPLTQNEIDEANKLKKEALEATQPQADKARDTYIEEQAENIATKTEVSKKEALEIAKQVAEGGRLGADYVLQLPCGKEGTIRELVNNFSIYNGQSMPDPIEGEDYGKTTATFWCEPGKAITINSFAHGGIKYTVDFIIDRYGEVQDMAKLLTDESDPYALELIDKVKFILAEGLGISIKEQDSFLESIDFNPYPIVKVIKSSFWYPNSNRLYLLNDEGNLTMFGGQDCAKFLFKASGSIVNMAKVKELAIQHFIDNTQCEEDTCIEKGNKKATSTNRRAIEAVLDFIKYRNQRTSISMQVDMFATTAKINLLEDAAEVVYPHKPFIGGDFDQSIVDDYIDHFPQVQGVLKQIVAARFASDRKQAYLWHKALSDNGKGFLYDGVLKELGCVVGLSVKEVENIFEGKPVGRTMLDFKRCMVLFFDEFKSVKSELKQLQNSITISPKNQLAVEVPIYSKIFASAEGVDSLITSAGIEDQFANRFSYIESNSSLKVRTKYVKTGKAAYYKSVKNYVARFLNNEIERLISLGGDSAQVWADNYLVEFHTEHSIDKVAERFSQSMPRVAAEFRAWAAAKFDNHNNNLCSVQPRASFGDDKTVGELMIKMGNHFYIKSPAKVLDLYIKANIDDSSQVSLKRKKQELMALISIDGKGSAKHRVFGEVLSGIKILSGDCKLALAAGSGLADEF